MFSLEFQNNDLILKNKYGVYSKQELETQLITGHLTVRELGSIYGLKEFQMVHALRVLHVEYRNPLSATRIFDPVISPSMHQVLIGTLLGDSYMKHPKVYEVGHGLNQMDYCYHVAERLHSFVASIGDKDIKEHKVFTFWTFRHDVFKPYFQRFYSHGKEKKFITMESARDLEPEGLAYWYMDDGKFKDYGAYLCVGKMTVQEGDILRALLKEKFGLETTFQRYHIEKGHYAIYIKAESRGHFFDLVSPYIIPSMKYKLEGNPHSVVDFSRGIIVNRHLELCRKAGRFIRYFGDKEIQDQLSNCVIESSKMMQIRKIKDAIRDKTQVSFSL